MKQIPRIVGHKMHFLRVAGFDAVTNFSPCGKVQKVTNFSSSETPSHHVFQSLVWELSRGSERSAALRASTYCVYYVLRM